MTRARGVSGRWPALLVALLVVLVTLAVFGRVLRFDFVDWDDPENVYQNPHFLPQVTWHGVGHFWAHSYFELYMPVTYSLWGLCAFLGRSTTGPLPRASGGTLPFSPVPFHALNLVCHIANAVLVYLLLLRLSSLFTEPKGDEESVSDWWRAIAAGAGALLFALHPIQVECVAWVTGANNVVSGLFCLLSLHAYLSSAQASSPRKGLGWFLVATLAFAVALFARPSAAALPLVALVLDALVLRRPWRRWAPGLLLWGIGAGAIALITRAGSASSRAAYLPLWGRPFIVGDALAFYMGKLIWPAQLGVDYGRHPLHVVLGQWWGYVTWLVPAMLGLLLWRFRLRWPAIGALLFVAAASPVLGFVPFYLHRISTVGDRYIYLSLLGPALALCWALLVPLRRVRAERTRTAVIGIVALCLLGLGARSLYQAGAWKDSITLFRNAVLVNPRSSAAYNNLSISQARRGAYTDALKSAQVAAQLRPDDAPTLNNLGIAFAQTEDYRSARTAFERAVSLDPTRAESHYHLGAVLVSLGEASEAASEFRETVQRNPKFEEAWFRLATTLGQAPGHTDEAISALQQVIRLNPNRAEAHYILGVLLGSEKRYAEAEEQFLIVIRITPDYAEAHYNLALVRERLGKPMAAEVLPEYREAARLAPNEPRYARALQEAQRHTSVP